MEKETLAMFKELTELQGTSGDEHRIRAFMRKELEPVSDEIIQDGLVAFLVCATERKKARVYLLQLIWMKLALW